MTQIINENLVQHRTLQWVVFVFSMVFVLVLSNGYYNLFVKQNLGLAFISGIGLAALAWGLAKFIGSSNEKIKGNIPLFVLLFILSAVGVFNALMINLEGKRIFQETIDNSQASFTKLKNSANTILKNPAIEAKKARVETLLELFIAELRNPQNCGQGPVAKELAKKIEQELKNFQVLSGSTTCKNIDDTIKSYETIVKELLIKSDEFTKADYIQTNSLADEVILVEENAQIQLNKLKDHINKNQDLLKEARDSLDDVASKYQAIALRLNGFSTKENVPSSLDLNSVKNLGEWSQIINLIISRRDQMSTYVYLSLALFFDWILIHLFSKLSELRRALPTKKSRQQSTDISTPW